MKAFITLAVICLVASVCCVELSEEQKAKAKVHIEECAKQENVSEEDAAKFRNKDYANPSKEFKCLTTCFFEKVGVLKDSQLQEPVVLEKLGGLIGDEKAKAALEKCRGTKGEDRCDTGFQLHQCFESAKAEF